MNRRIPSLPLIFAIAGVVLASPSHALAEPPIWESNVGSSLGLTDDSTYETTLDFLFQYQSQLFTPGATISISSNGFLSLGGSNGSGCCSPTGANLMAPLHTPIIAPAWTDLIPDPGVSADVYLNRFNDSGGPSNDRLVVTWLMKVYTTGLPVRAQVQLKADGTITFGYNGYDFTGNNRNVLVGIGPSIGSFVTDPGSTDLSASMPFSRAPQPNDNLATPIYELFTAPNPAVDFDQTNIVFTPNGVAGFRVTRETCRPPVWDANHNTYCCTGLGLTDDSTVETTFGSLNFSFPFDGIVYSSGSTLSISSNGFVSFGGTNGSDCCNGDSFRLTQAPYGRIAAMWTDLVPGNAGDVFITQLDFSGGAYHRLAITWETIFYAGRRPVAAQLQLHDDGTFSLGWDCWYGTNMLRDVLVGTSRGGEVADPGSTDLSATVPYSTGTDPTTYELFRTDGVSGPAFDLGGKNLFFRPSGFGGWNVSTNCPNAPIWEPNFGTNLGLGDDGTFETEFSLQRFSFPFGGTTFSGHTPLSISSNGFVSLGGSNGQGCCNGNVAGFLSGFARIAPLWTDLLPRGETYLNVFRNQITLRAERFVVTWDSLFFRGRGTVTSQLQLFSNGTIVMSYQCADRVGAFLTDALAGITLGGGAADPGPTNLAALAPFDSRTRSTIYEMFPTSTPPLGLAGRSLVFEPNGRGGYHVGTNLAAAGTVNSGAGVNATRDVLRVNGSAGTPLSRIVTVPQGAPITVTLDAAPAGPAANAGYALWVWAGSNFRPTELSSGANRIGCFVNPTPLNASGTPQPVLCLHSQSLPAAVCRGLSLTTSPNSAPWSATRPGGFNHATRFTLQGILRDDGAANALHFSATNAVVINVP